MNDRRHTLPADEGDAHGTRGQNTGASFASPAKKLGIAPDPITGQGDVRGLPYVDDAGKVDAGAWARLGRTIAEGRAVGDKVDALIAERGKVHGNFSDHARITQRLKDVILDELNARHERGQSALTPEMREALDMNMHKVGRIVAGDADFRDHWDDIGGYSRLVSERCSK